MAMRYLPDTILALTFLAGFAVPRLAAQSSLPQTYSASLISRTTYESMSADRESNVKLYRNGSKELVEVTIAASAGKPRGVQVRYLFDLPAHKAYKRDMVNNTCSWMRYVDADMPSNYDPIAASATSLADLAQQNAKVVGTENVNGIPAKIEEISGPEGKSRVWIAEKGNFVVETEMPGPDGKPLTLLEVKQVSFSKPPDSLFAPPSNCDTQAPGEMSSTGISAHAETTLPEVKLSTNVNLGEKESKPHTEVSVGQPIPAGTSGATIMRVWVHPDYFKGSCPHQYTFYAGLQSTGPGDVRYAWIRSDGATSAPKVISFSGPHQSRTVQESWTLSGDPGKINKQWEQFQLDPPNGAVSQKIPITLVCTQ